MGRDKRSPLGAPGSLDRSPSIARFRLGADPLEAGQEVETSEAPDQEVSVPGASRQSSRQVSARSLELMCGVSFLLPRLFAA